MMAQKNNGEKLRVFTGGASKAIKWHQIYKDDFCIVEVIATVVSIQRNPDLDQEIILVRDKSGPILQVIRYPWDHSEIDAIQVGQIISSLASSHNPQSVGEEDERVWHTGGVVANGIECSAIGRDIFNKGGSVVDAAIATLLAEGIAMPQSMGLGGGFFMLIYIKEAKSVYALDAREVAPLRATQDMFVKCPQHSVRGGLAVATPGELAGYWEAHQKFGKLPWAEIIQPAIELCDHGHTVTAYLAQMLRSQESQLQNDPTLREVFIDPSSGCVYQEGQRIRRPHMRRTLEVIAQTGAAALYNGPLTAAFVKDIQDRGGIIGIDDMKTYKVKWREPISLLLPNGDTLFTMQVPASGDILIFILNILHGFLEVGAFETPLNVHRVVEAFKFAFAKRSQFGDPDFVQDMRNLSANVTSASYAAQIRKQINDNQTFPDPKHYGANYVTAEDQGTAHICAIAPNGDAVSATSTINLLFGAGFQSNSTGIILNNEMDDFSSPDMCNAFNIPPSPANFIAPGKRPMSSMCPTIIIDQSGHPRLVIGSAGGSKIITTVALVILRYLIFGESITQAVNSTRLHHQLNPMAVYLEKEFNPEMVRCLEQLGHRVVIANGRGFAALTLLAVENGNVQGAFDPRRGGNVSYTQ